MLRKSTHNRVLPFGANYIYVSALQTSFCGTRTCDLNRWAMPPDAKIYDLLVHRTHLASGLTPADTMEELSWWFRQSSLVLVLADIKWIDVRTYNANVKLGLGCDQRVIWAAFVLIFSIMLTRKWIIKKNEKPIITEIALLGIARKGTCRNDHLRMIIGIIMRANREGFFCCITFSFSYHHWKIERVVKKGIPVFMNRCHEKKVHVYGAKTVKAFFG